MLRLSARVAWSIIPSLAGRVLAVWDPAETLPRWPQNPAEELLARNNDGQRIAVCGPLVAKLTDSEITDLALRFKGVTR